MKKLPVWKLTLLVIFTFGIYFIIWAFQTRKYLNETYKQNIRSGLWLVIPAAVAIALLIPATFIATFAVIGARGSETDLAYLLTVIFSILLLIPFVISVWWMWRFGRAVGVATQQKLPNFWSMTLYILLGQYVSLFQQYYLNRSSPEKKTGKKVIGRPSGKFIALAISLIILVGGAGIASSVSTFATLPAEFDQLLKDEGIDFETLYKQFDTSDELRHNYDTCVEEMNAEYGDTITEEQEVAYNKKYDKCEELRHTLNDYIDSTM